MQAGATLFNLLNRIEENLVFRERAILHGHIQPDIVLKDHTTRPDVEVPGLRVARFPHL